MLTASLYSSFKNCLVLTAITKIIKNEACTLLSFSIRFNYVGLSFSSSSLSVLVNKKK